jgi:DNA-binding LytR/AlgR family response regulator
MQEDTRVLIVEDEELWAKSLCTNLQDFGFKVVDTANNFHLAVTAFNKRDYDIVLLDIHLDGRESGIELGHMLYKLYHKPFIFITASYDAQTAHTAVAAQPSAYLTKPVHPASLFATIQTAIRNFSENQVGKFAKETLNEDSFFVKQGEKYKKIYWQDIVCLRSEKNYTGLLSSADSITYYIRSTLPKTLRYLIPANMQDNFMQINRSEAIQLSFIKELFKDQIYTSFGTFTVSESHQKTLKERLRILG